MSVQIEDARKIPPKKTIGHSSDESNSKEHIMFISVIFFNRDINGCKNSVGATKSTRTPQFKTGYPDQSLLYCYS